MQFGRTLSHILQEIWEAEPAKGPVRVSNMDVMDAYHRGMICPSYLGSFAYAIPSADDDVCIIICIGMILHMGWLNSHKFFCKFSEKLTDMENDLVNMSLPVPA